MKKTLNALTGLSIIGTPFSVPALPEAPSLRHQVYQIETVNNAGSALTPIFPALQTSWDGRVGYNWTTRGLYMVSPEKLTSPFATGAPGPQLIVSTEAHIGALPERIISKNNGTLEESHGAYFAGMTTCNSAPASQQPRSCNAGHDCYDMSLIGFHIEPTVVNGIAQNSGRLRSRKMIIEVANPKTPRAQIIAVTPIGDLKESPRVVVTDKKYVAPDVGGNESFFAAEPLITNDGRLYLTRLAYRSLFDESAPIKTDIVYLVAPKSADPCDASAFAEAKTISYAYYDPNMKDPDTGKARYGFTEYPLRDTMGRPIDKFANVGTYPWMDRDGKNLFFQIVDSTLFRNDRKATRYEAACVDGIACASNEDSETGDNVRGMAVAGLWTHGKTVLLDGMINHTDYGFKRHIIYNRKVKLYEPLDDFNGWVRIGSGRDTLNINNQWNAMVPSIGPLTGVIGSFENLFNAYRFMRPQLAKDIVWTMTNGATSEEISFDDYIDPRAIIVSTMTATVEFEKLAPDFYFWKHHDGFPRGTTQQTEAVWIQNAATTISNNIPKYGLLSKGRLEPVALGGIHGKGLWLSQSQLDYRFPKPIPKQELFVSIFIDPRPQNEDTFSKLLAFPDGTEVRISANRLRFYKYIQNGKTTIKKDFSLRIPSRQWSHLAFSIDTTGKSLSVYKNGMNIGIVNFPKALFQLRTQSGGAGNIRVGVNAENGFRGWVDEFKVFSYIPELEVICNHAYGSLHALKETTAPYWIGIANQYPEKSHQDIFNHLPASWTQEMNLSPQNHFVCAIDYSDHLGIYRAKDRTSDGLLAVRDALLFAVPNIQENSYSDGRLHWNSPRVDFSKNNFCLSCHGETERRGFSLTALAAGSVCALQDPRRQPSQSPKLLPGNTTAEQFNAISLDSNRLIRFDQSSGALLSDPLTLPTKSNLNCVP